MLRPALLALALVTALPAAGEIYNWKDKDGTTHYSDIPPAKGEVKTLRAGPAARPAPAASVHGGEAATQPAAPGTANASPAADGKPKTLAERELEFRQRRAAEAEAQAKAEKEAEDAAQKARACEQARNQLTALTSGQRVSRFNASGERVVIDDAERAAEVTRTQEQIDRACN